VSSVGCHTHTHTAGRWFDDNAIVLELLLTAPCVADNLRRDGFIQ